MYKHLLYEEEKQIATIKINNPKTLNALNTETLNELNQCIQYIENKKDVKVVIITGCGDKSFVAGADISEMIHASPAEGRGMALLAKEAFCRLESLPQVTIAAVNGYALGGGCELSMACDVRVASAKAKFGQPECGLGILPGFGGTQRLSRLVGKGRAKEMIFTCDTIDAEEAYRIGLVNKLVPAEQLMDRCLEMAGKIVQKGSYAISLAKKCIDNGFDSDLNTGLDIEAVSFGLAFATNDKREGMKAFLEKRQADLTDF